MKRFNIFGFLCLLLFFTVPSILHAAIFDTVLRKGAKITDNVPIRGADDLAETMAKSKAAREALENSTRKSLKAVDNATDYANQLKHALKTDLQKIDPSLVRYADSLDKPAQEYLFVLGRGAKSCEQAVPDMLNRAKFMERCGAETVSAIGLYGDDMTRSALRVDRAIQSGKLVSPAGMRAVQLDDFGKLFTTYGDSAHRFWNRYVVPHWGKWLGGGVLAWYLIDPEGFMDSAGELTQEGINRLAGALGDATEIVISGAAEGISISIEKIAETTGEASVKVGGTIIRSFFMSWKGLLAAIVLLFVAALAFPWTRFWLLRPFRFLLRSPQ